MESMYDCYELNHGVRIPCMGFGTYKAADASGTEVLKLALEAGYRYFDTASFYGNEEAVGQMLKDGKVKREEVVLASKAWKDEMGYSEVKQAFFASLKRLQTDYLDIYLIHWPIPEPGYREWKQLDIDTWKAMEELYKEGYVKTIGVSNFLPHHLENLICNAEICPAVNQIEFHPGYTQEAVLSYCREKNIRVQAWSPLGRRALLNHPLLVEIAGHYEISVAQLCIRYAIQRGVIPLPKASAPERLKENQDVFSFCISKEDMYMISCMPQTAWSGQHPDYIGERE